MRVAIFGFGALSLTVFLFLHFYLEPKFKPDVSSRFIERADIIPSTKEAITIETLRSWINGHPLEVKSYLMPIIFPLDFIFMISLAGFLALVSLALVETLPWLQGVQFWIWIIAPRMYLLADFWEDSLILWVLSASSRLDGMTFSILRTVTAMKIFTVKIAIAEVTILLALALGRRAYASFG